MTDLQQIGIAVRERWRSCLSEYGRQEVCRWRGAGGTNEVLLTSMPVIWFADGFAASFDPCRVRPTLKSPTAGMSKEELNAYYFALDTKPGRPKAEGLRTAATVACFFYDAWRLENQTHKVRDYGQRSAMKDYAARAVVEDLFAWRLSFGVKPGFAWEMGSPKDVEALIESVRCLMDKPYKRRDPGEYADVEFPSSEHGLVLKLPPKPHQK